VQRATTGALEKHSHANANHHRVMLKSKWLNRSKHYWRSSFTLLAMQTIVARASSQDVGENVRNDLVANSESGLLATKKFLVKTSARLIKAGQKWIFARIEPDRFGSDGRR
jgi:hypothetical protein